MQEDKYIDPRLQAKEKLFEQLHLSVFDTMAHAQAAVHEYQTTENDLAEDNSALTQLQRDYAITRNLTKTEDSVLEPLVELTDKALATSSVANIFKSQVCAAAINSLNHFRIISEIPDDLMDVEQVTKTIRSNYHMHQTQWRELLSDFASVQTPTQ